MAFSWLTENSNKKNENREKARLASRRLQAIESD